MKIRIITPSRPHAASWASAVAQAEVDFQVTTVVQSLPEVNVLINGSRPDLVVAETATPADFDSFERLASRHPELEYVLVGSGLSSEMLMRAMRAGVREVLPPDCEAAAVAAAVLRLARKHSAASASGHASGQVIGLLSSKGGCGTTFIATNLAHLLADEGAHRVALLDLNLQFGDAGLFLSSDRPSSNVAELARNIQRLDKELLMSAMSQVSPGLWVLPAPEDPSQAADVTPQHVDAILQMARTTYDYVIVDMGRSISAVTLQALDRCDRIYAVLQLSLPFLRNAGHLRDLFRSLDYPPQKIHWIVNRADRNSDITLDDLKKTLQLADLVVLPNQYGPVIASVNQGVPVERLAPSSAIARSLRELAHRIAPPPSTLERNRNSWLSSLFAGRRATAPGV